MKAHTSEKRKLNIFCVRAGQEFTDAARHANQLEKTCMKLLQYTAFFKTHAKPALPNRSLIDPNSRRPRTISDRAADSIDRSSRGGLGLRSALALRLGGSARLCIADGLRQHLAQLSLRLRRFSFDGSLPVSHELHVGIPEPELNPLDGQGAAD